MKITKISATSAIMIFIAVAGLFATGCKQNKKSDKTITFNSCAVDVNGAIISCSVDTDVRDSVDYLAGIQMGGMLRQSNICSELKELNLNLMKEGMTAAIHNEAEFGTEEFNNAFKIHPDKMGPVMDAFIMAKRDSAYVPVPSQIDSVSYLLGMNFGYMYKNWGIADSIDELNLDEIREGAETLLGMSEETLTNEEEALKAFKINPMLINRLIPEYTLAKTKSKGENFLNSVAGREGAVRSESGLVYEILEPGNEVKPTAQDEVSVYYNGTLINGKKFDGNIGAEEPITFGLSNVIKGWTEGLQYIGEGGKIKLYIPSDLAYGDRGAGYMIKGGETLIFEVELVKVTKAPVEEEAAEAPAAEAETYNTAE